MSQTDDRIVASDVSEPAEATLAAPPEKRKRKIVPYILVALALVASVISWLLLTPLVRITPENCARIKPGMTQQDVEGILGGPPGMYDGLGEFQFVDAHPAGKGAGLEWTARDGDVVIVFDKNGQVAKSTFYPIRVTAYDQWSLVVERVTRCTLSRWEWWWAWG
jgi:hypothetical protein